MTNLERLKDLHKQRAALIEKLAASQPQPNLKADLRKLESDMVALSIEIELAEDDR